MELRRLFDALLRKFWMICIFSVAGALVAGAFATINSSKTYSAGTSLYIMNKGKMALTGEGLTYQDMVLSKQLVQDYSGIIRSNKVLSAVAKDLNNPDINEGMLGGAISVGLSKDSNLMTLNVTWDDPDSAVLIANSVSKVFIQKIKEMTGADSVGIVDDAKTAFPVSSNSKKMVVIGFAAGMMIALAIIYIAELFDTTIRNAEEIEYGLKLKVVGMIPEHDIR